MIFDIVDQPKAHNKMIEKNVFICFLKSINGAGCLKYPQPTSHNDLTFSTNKRNFPPEIAFPFEDEVNRWQVGKKLENMINKQGFKMSFLKVGRDQFPGTCKIIWVLIFRIGKRLD